MGGFEKAYTRDILKRVSTNYYDCLIFAGIVDEEAKLVDYQKGTMASFQLPNARQNVLDIQVSLIFALAKQFEDFTGSLAHTVLTFDDYDVIIMDISTGTILYVICTAGTAADIVDAFIRMTEDCHGKETNSKRTFDVHDQDPVSTEWSG